MAGVQEEAKGRGSGRGGEEEGRRSEVEEFHRERPARPGGQQPEASEGAGAHRRGARVSRREEPDKDAQ